MNVTQMREWIAAKDWTAIESAWLAAVETEKDPAAQEVAQVLEALNGAGRTDLAETLAWTLLSERAEKMEPRQALALAQAVCLALPSSKDIRQLTRDGYHRVYSAREDFDALLSASGLLGNQSPRRAFRTLDVCLGLQPGDYLANRFDHRVVRILSFDRITGEFLARDEDGHDLTLEPKVMADEFQNVAENDFRVLSRRPTEEVDRILQDDPAGVLVALCLASGGQIDSAAIKERLVPDYLSPDKWSPWWNKARTAAKRSPNLTLEGRNPILVAYHPGGRTLEEEMAERIAAAKTPLEHLAALRDYIRETRTRKLEIDMPTAGRMVTSLGDQARAFLHKRPADAMVAALAIQEAVRMGLPAPADAPTPTQVLGLIQNRPQAMARIEDEALWEPALDALLAGPAPRADLEALLDLATAEQLGAISDRLLSVGGEQAVRDAVAKVLSDPAANIELCLWLWNASQPPVSDTPPRLELLARLLKALQDLDHDWEMPQARKKATQRRIRAALASRDYGSFRQAADEMTEAVAGIMKGRIERAEGLAETVRDELLGVLRERFYRLFAKTRVKPWLDENTLWTTEAALHRREAELKELKDVKMLANAKAIGAAAELGDLSENSEFKYALEQRDILRGQAAKMTDEITKARVIRPENVPDDHVGIGCKVTLVCLADQQSVEMTFLGPWDSDLSARIYSYQTPLAQSLMGKKPGETVALKLDAGDEKEYRIDKIESVVKDQHPQ